MNRKLCRKLCVIDSGLVGRGSARAEDAQETTTLSHVLPSIVLHTKLNRGKRHGRMQVEITMGKADSRGAVSLTTFLFCVVNCVATRNLAHGLPFVCRKLCGKSGEPQMRWLAGVTADTTVTVS